MNLLEVFAQEFKTDKAGVYTRIYDLVWRDYRQEVERVLEMGIFKGASLRMWEAYFPNAEIIGLDISQESVDIGNRISPRVHCYLVDCGSQESLSGFVNTKNVGYDFVIDDASHDCDHQIMAFKTFWPWIRSEGAFSIEDDGRSYLQGLSGHRSGSCSSSVRFAQELVDSAKILDVPGNREELLTDVREVLFSHGVSIITKR